MNPGPDETEKTVSEMDALKLLSVTVPCYNSQDYMDKAIESLLTGGPEMEILIVDDGSSDRTAEIADDYMRRYPDVIRVVHQENGGHGDAVMTGLKNAAGLYFKVVDSDDRVDPDALSKVLDVLRAYTDQPLDMFISNYVYDKVGVEHKRVISYRGTLPQDRVFGWNETGHFKKGRYLLMHSVIYNTELLRRSGLTLPKHTFYVDELYVYVPLTEVERMYYLDADLYWYYIGREGQSVQEQVLLKRIDQYLLVNRLLVSEVDPFAAGNEKKRKYMLNFLEIITVASSALLAIIGTEESSRKKTELWAYIRETNPKTYQALRHRWSGRLVHLPGAFGRCILTGGYRICQRIFGFN